MNAAPTTIYALTAATCGPGCWYAREDVCRCSCAGASHGVLLQGGEQPLRNRRIQGTRYVLDCVIVGYGAAHGYARDTLGAYRTGDKGGDVRTQPASDKHLASWPELAGFTASPFLQQHPYLIWTRVA